MRTATVENCAPGAIWVCAEGNLQAGTNWWGAFVIGLAGTILVTGAAPTFLTVFGASYIPVLVGYYLLRKHRPNVTRPFRLPEYFKWVALGLAVLYFIVWLGGGIAYSFIGDQAIYYFIGWVVAACYLPLYWLRKREDQRQAAPERQAVAAVPHAHTAPPRRPLTEES